MTEQVSSRDLEFQTFRLGEPVSVFEYTGYGRDRIQTKIGPYYVWMEEDFQVFVVDNRIKDEDERLARARRYTIAEAADAVSALIQDRPDYCTAAELSEVDRVVALWASAYLLIEGSRYITIEGYPDPNMQD